MSKIRTIDEMDCEDMKDYCRWEGSPCSGGPNGPICCEGCYCTETYAKWYEEHAVTCDCCGLVVDVDICTEVTDMSDGTKHYVCEDCELEGAKHDR